MKKLYRTVFSKPLQIYQDSYGLKMSTFLLSKKILALRAKRHIKNVFSNRLV